MKKLFSLVLTFALGAFLLSSCDENDPGSELKGEKGVYIINEGAFNANNGTISFYNEETGTVTQSYFESVNGRPLGDIVQSMTVADEKAFIVVNNSQKVEIVDMEDFGSLKTLTGIDYPRYAINIDDQKVYLSNGSFAGQVYVIDMASLSITDTIEVGYGPENMIKYGDKVYVANSGGWTSDNKVSVLDTKTNTKIKDIEVGDNPTDIDIDKNGNIWVLCKGKVVYNSQPPYDILEQTTSSLVVIDPNTNQVTKTIEISETQHPTRLAMGKNGEFLYYVTDATYKMSVDATTIPTEKFIDVAFYGLEVHPVTGEIFGFHSPTFGQAGKLSIYSTEGNLVNELTTGIGPNGAYFYL